MMSSSLGGMLALRRTGDVGIRLRIPSRTTAVDAPGNARRPVTISYSTAPREKMSVRESRASPQACSGDMYAIVPITWPLSVSIAVRVLWASSNDTIVGSSLARPKSRI